MLPTRPSDPAFFGAGGSPGSSVSMATVSTDGSATGGSVATGSATGSAAGSVAAGSATGSASMAAGSGAALGVSGLHVPPHRRRGRLLAMRGVRR